MSNPIEDEIRDRNLRQKQYKKEQLIVEILEIQKTRLEDLNNDELKMIIKKIKK